jgi:hypothetical protein
MSENGEPKVDKIILTFTREPWQLRIDGEVENDNIAISMLNEAIRVFDLRWKVGSAKEMQKEEKQLAIDTHRVQEILSRTRKQ